jgi:hypothetical protein
MEGRLTSSRNSNALVGMAVSDIDPDYRGRVESALAENVDALELQPELGTWQVPRQLRRRRFLAVHAPSQGRDIASPNPSFRERSLADVKTYLRFAAGVGAAVYLLHPGQIYHPANIAAIAVRHGYPFVSSFYWADPDRRRLMASALESSVEQLLEFRHSLGLPTPIALENLGFPNLGTTFCEIEQVQIALARRFGLTLVLDVPHLWVSRHTLLQHPELAPWLAGFPADQQSFYTELAGFVKRYADLIAYYHLYAATTQQEHLPIRADFSYRPTDLDLCRVARIVGPEKPIITEVFRVSRQEKLRSMLEMSTILTRCAGTIRAGGQRLHRAG